MPLLVRSWNVFHGRTYPPGRQAYLEEAIVLAAKDDPDIVCLQELPLWSLRRLEAWSGMAAFSARTRHRLGRVGGRLTDLHHGVLRSSLAGQANAVLVARRHTVDDHLTLVLNDRRFCREVAQKLGLGRGVRRAWARERRVCQALRIPLVDGAPVMLLNLHLTHLRERPCAEAELQRAVRFAEEQATAGEPLVVAGDFNLTADSLAVVELVEKGFSGPGPGIDHVLVRGLPSTPLEVWPVERRAHLGRTLSDHPPVELSVG
jgi:endonuclease/exonuclease/phosphatase family metal-dependent hydrolase